jgi:predicted ArsR family transcriptional regulator
VKTGGVVVECAGGPVAVPEAVLPTDVRTRDRVARALLERGPVSAAALADQLGLTPAAVRRHLDVMTADGLVGEAPERPVRGRVRGRGRPARLFALSEAGRAAFPHGYDDIALSALRFLATTGGEDAVRTFAEHRLAPVEERYAALLDDAADPVSRVEALARALTSDGYAAGAEISPTGAQLCQHHCPVAHVAEEFPALCDAETALIARLLGSHVQRLATLAHGDGVCTTHVPRTTPAPASGKDPQ